MMYIADAAAGLVIGALSGMGIGSGGLLVIYLTSLRALSQLEAQGCNLVFFVFSSFSSLFIHRQRRSINFALCGICAAAAICGSLLGVYVSGLVRENTVRRIFGGMLLLLGTAALYKFFSRRKRREL